MPIDVTVEMPLDWVGSVVVPAITILISSGIAIWVASFERKRARTEAARAEAADLIRALASVARSFQYGEVDAMNDSTSRLEQALNTFAAQLSRRDAVVAKFIAVVTAHADSGQREFVPRTYLWLITVVELWLRGELKRTDFAKHMPTDTSAWSECVDLADHQAVLNGQPVAGWPDIVQVATREVPGE